MRSSSKDSRAAAGIGSRLAGALIASLFLHALLVGSVPAPFGARWGSLDWFRASAPLRAALRPMPAQGEPESLLAAQQPVQAAPSPPAPSPAPAPAGKPPAADPQRALLPQPHYYLTRELDVRPGIMTRVEPEYPEAAARRFLSGKVVLRLYIEETGAVERVEILAAEPPGYFEESVRRAFGAARFTPGMKDGRAVRVQMTLEVSFESPSAPASQIAEPGR
ncbi:MAG TPA: energy transducer TonB [Burkholderiales bacterium]|nr:energy transducer TonB [Burkholderiales bacterium]